MVKLKKKNKKLKNVSISENVSTSDVSQEVDPKICVVSDELEPVLKKKKNKKKRKFDTENISPNVMDTMNTSGDEIDNTSINDNGSIEVVPVEIQKKKEKSKENKNVSNIETA